MDPDSTNNENDAVANLIAILRLTDTIKVNDETIEKNSETGTLNDGIAVHY